MELEFPKKLNLAQLPTPIQKLSRLSEFFGGPTLYIKRDDLTGIGLSGNKIRKLEFTLYEALRGGADTVITCGGIGSNHARATAVAARQLGLTPVLVLRGKPGRYPDGNLLLDSLLGAELKFISREDYSESRDAVMDDLAAQWEKRGHHAYVIPEGASNAVGAWGYANAFLEMHRQLSEKKLKIDAVVCAVGSGGTQAGLLIGAETAHWEGEILGINVCDDAAFFKERIGGILNAFRRKYKAPLQISEDDIHLIDGYVGRGYALSRPEELQVIKD
ncbi:MAG TPA: D-cysteine desulfhydrase family protein, partial [Bacteroidetes bacterium]|nr:D-cysteine desulfhydrase family protein [Bacteroidota bacterium]